MNKIFFRGLVAVCLSLFFSLDLFAQKIDSSFYKSLEPVNVYALKGGKLTKNIKLSHGDWVQHDAGQVLLQVPGFSSIKKSGSFGFDPVFRGMKNDQLSILTDGGIGAHAACPNRMDPPSSQVMINQVKELEILKGPHNFRFGPATGAVINFKTIDPVFTPNPKMFGRANVGYESNGNVFRSEGMLGVRSKKLEFSLAGSYSKGDDYKDGNDSIMPASFSRGAVQLNLAYKVNANQQATVTVSRNFARNTEFPTLNMDLLSDDTWMMQGTYQVTSTSKWYNKWITQVNTSLVDHQMGNGLRPTSASMLSHVFADTRSSGARTEFQINRNNARIFLGADVKQEYANGVRSRKMITGPMAGKTFYDTLWQKGIISRGGLFLHADKKLGEVDISFSTRADVVYGKPDAVSSKFGKSYADVSNLDINPSVSMGISRSFQNSFKAGVWLGRGIRSASITERFINYLPVGSDPYEVVGNPLLKPEANLQLDVMLQYKTERTLVQFTPFSSWVKGYISSIVDPGLKPVIATAPGVRRFVNLDQAELFGYEFTAKYDFTKWISNEFNLSYVKGKNKENDQPLPEINPLELRYSVKGSMLKGLISPSISVRHNAAQNNISAAFNERRTTSFTVVDLGMNVSVKENWKLSFAVQNLFDVAYREHLSRFIRPTLPLNTVGRNLIVMMGYQF